jgi:Fe2+ or Zn2+ uptake regulation protein
VSPREQFREFLAARNLKLTPRRDRVLQAFLASSGPVRAEDLLESGDPGEEEAASLATLYRTLGLLELAGLARRVRSGPGPALFVAVRGHSCWLVCERCGQRVPLCNPYLESLQEVAARQEGFELKQCSTRMTGLCPACLAREEGKTGV